MWILFLFGKGCFQRLIFVQYAYEKFKLWSWIVCGFLLLFLGATFVFINSVYEMKVSFSHPLVNKLQSMDIE